jgi:D-proline reductase (dithiol) PrdB
MNEQASTNGKTVNSFKFVPGLTRRVVRAWIKREQPRPIPWTPLSKPLAECTLALISTAGLVLKEERPFDQEGERQNPWWGDPSYRLLPHTTREKDIRLCHLHVNPVYAEEDLNCIFPLQRLSELVDEGSLGRLAPTHYSFMGYILRPQVLLEESVPAMIRHLQAEEVDVVLLVPV